MKLKRILTTILYFIIFFSISDLLFAQKNASEIVSENYKFTFTIPQEAFNLRKEETSEKNAITYEFESTANSDTIGVLLLAFKYPDIKKLNDFVYHMEKEVSLDIPRRTGDYTEYDSVYHDAKMAVYKNKNLTHVIYYYRTKDESSQYNFTYLLRFKVFTNKYDDEILNYMKAVAANFIPRRNIDVESSD